MIDPYELNLRHLAAVSAAGRLGSISAAAHAMNLSQPAATQAIAKVEAQLGHRLFDRQSIGVSPTEAGGRMIRRIDRAVSYLVRGTRAIRRGGGLPPLPHIERRVTLGQLRALVAVDGHGSFALASARTTLSEPALHRAVRELESHLALPMVTRQGRTVRPTPAAQRLLTFVRLAMSELDAGLDELAALVVDGAGRLTLGTMPLARAILLPQTLARFSRAYPSASVKIVEGPYDELLAGLRQGEIAMLIGALRDRVPLRDVIQEALFTDDPVIVGRAGHPLAAARPEMADLVNYPWAIAATGTPIRQHWEEMFVAQGLAAPRPRVECGSMMVLRGLLLLEGDWLTVMSRDQFLFEQRAGLLKEIASGIGGMRREIGLTLRQDWHPTPLQDAFLTMIKAAGADRNSAKAMKDPLFRYG
jgi:LysR family transcriptional regulator of gallate degradation